MSMISAQIDELRELAGDGSMEWVTGPIRASVLRDAADTIWQLRDDLQRTNAEADKLREELAIREASEQEKVIEYLRQENIDWEDKYRALAAENAKLRELVRDLHMAYVGALNEAESMDEGLIWEHCEMVDAELAKSHVRFEADRHRFDTAMRELGIEVES